MVTSSQKLLDIAMHLSDAATWMINIKPIVDDIDHEACIGNPQAIRMVDAIDQVYRLMLAINKE